LPSLPMTPPQMPTLDLELHISHKGRKMLTFLPFLPSWQSTSAIQRGKSMWKDTTTPGLILSLSQLLGYQRPSPSVRRGPPLSFCHMYWSSFCEIMNQLPKFLLAFVWQCTIVWWNEIRCVTHASQTILDHKWFTSITNSVQTSKWFTN
jgi:hypothetical protein